MYIVFKKSKKGEAELKPYNPYYVQRPYSKYNWCKNFNFNDVPISRDNGYIEISITKELGTEVATDAILTIYVNQNGNRIAVKRLSPKENPTLIELPIAHPAGNLVKGPEYYFTPYDLTIESEGYYRIETRNIRLFPNIKAMFFYNLNKIIPGVPNEDKKLSFKANLKANKFCLL